MTAARWEPDPAALKRDYRELGSIRAVAALHGQTYGTTRDRLIAAGAIMQALPGRSWRPAKGQLRAMYKRHGCIRGVAAEAEVAYSTARARLIAAGIQLGARGGYRRG